MNILNRFFKIVITFFSSLFIGICFLRSINSTSRITQGELVNFIRDNWGLNIFICFFVLAICLFLSRQKSIIVSDTTILRILTILDILVAVILVVLLYLYPLKPVADQHYVLEAASDLVNKQYDLLAPGSYFSYHPHQVGLILVNCIFTLIFGEYPYFILQILNVLFYICSIRILSTISLYIWNSPLLSNVVHLCSLFFLPMWCYVGFVYGTIPGLFFALLSFLFAFKAIRHASISVPYSLVSILLMGVAILLKKNYLIMMIALVIFFLLAYIKQRSHLTNFLLLIPSVILVYFFATQGPIFILKATTPVTIGDGVPSSSYIAMGLQEDETTPGWFNGYNFFVYQNNGRDSQAAHNESMTFIKQRLWDFAKNRQRYAIGFFAQKNASMWNDPTFGGYSFIRSTPVEYVYSNLQRSILFSGNLLNQILERVQDIFMMLTYLGVVLYLLNIRKAENNTDFLFLIVFIGGYLFHTFWEAKSQYTFPYFYLLLGHACAGYRQTILSLHEQNYKKECVKIIPLVLGLLISLLPYELIASYFRLPDQTSWNKDLQGVVTSRLYSTSYILSSENDPSSVWEVDFSWSAPDQVHIVSYDHGTPVLDGYYYPQSLGQSRILFYTDKEQSTVLTWNDNTLSSEPLTWSPSQTWQMYRSD
ncbi:MAG: hypothetical protein K5682_10275 [Lachnospiraceae bacterium]|nr:hypothetical protein [Lachnospiraceae bacterium]